jgi:hypothetical protein
MDKTNGGKIIGTITVLTARFYGYYDTPIKIIGTTVGVS